MQESEVLISRIIYIILKIIHFPSRHLLKGIPMMATTFDTLHFAKRAKEAGFTEAQAEFQAEALSEIIDGLATKKDLNALESALKQEFKHDIQEMAYKLIISMGGMFAVAIGVI